MSARFSFPVFVVCLIALFLPGLPALAHTPLKSSQPAAQAQLASAPETLELEFGGLVNLVRLNLSHQTEGEVALEFKPSTQRARDFSIPLPPLKTGSYSLRWAAVGEDGHMVQGTIPFSISSP